MASTPPPARLPLSAGLAAEAIGAMVAVVASARRRNAVDEGIAKLADIALRLQADLGEQEVQAAMGPLPTKGAALVGAERKGEDGGGDGR